MVFWLVDIDAQRNMQVHQVEADLVRTTIQEIDADDVAMGRDLRQIHFPASGPDSERSRWATRARSFGACTWILKTPVSLVRVPWKIY